MTTPSERRASADAIDHAILRALQAEPNATIVAIAETTGLSRNTIRSRLQRYADGALHPFDRRVRPAFLGNPLRAYVFTTVEQRHLDAIGEALAAIPEILSVEGVSGVVDLLIQVAARDTDDLYRVAGAILGTDGVQRTEVGLVMRTLVEHRVLQLIPDSARDKT